MSISMSDSYDLATECIDILSSEEAVPQICMDLVDDALELAINSSYSFEKQRPETTSLNSQTLAAQIAYDAKQSYLAEIDEATLGTVQNTQRLTTYDPHQVAYVELSTEHGISASTKGIQMVAYNHNQPKFPKRSKKEITAWTTGLILAAIAVGVVAFTNPSSQCKTTGEDGKEKVCE